MNASVMEAWADGIVCFWDAKPTNHAFLKGAMDAVGVGDYCPPPYSVGESLKRAMADYGRSHRKSLLDGFENRTNTTLEVKRHENANEDGYEMVAVEHGKDRNIYSPVFAAKVEINGTETVDITSGWSTVTDRYEMQASYEANRRTCSASSVGQMLVKMVSLLNGTCVREIGGVYYLPNGAAEAWQELCNAVESPNGTQITWHEIRLNESSMRSIASAITKEIMADAAKLMDEVQSGELGKRAIENRQGLLGKLRRKAKEYEGILDSPLQDVRKALQEAETAAAMANMLAASDAA